MTRPHGAPGFTGRAVLTPTADAALVELLARDVDAVIVDLEHGAVDDAAVATAVLVAHAAGVRIAIRCVAEEPARTARFLDAGGDGVVAARVDDARAAAAWVALVHPPPTGNRGMSAPRGGGWRSPLAAAPWLCVQIESAHALTELDAIAGTPGVDALLAGTRDLSYSIGVPGELGHPRILTALDSIAATARRHDVGYVAVGGRPGGTGTAGGAGAHPAQLEILPLAVILQRGLKGPQT